MILYEGDWTFDVPEWAQNDGGWTPDCNGKLDFDPTLLHFSCRTWTDNDYSCSLYLGEHRIVESGILRAESRDHAKVAVREWCVAQTARVKEALVASAIETQRAETEGLGPQDESAALKGDAQPTPGDPHE